MLAGTVSTNRQTLLEVCLCPDLHKKLEEHYSSKAVFADPDINSAQKKLGGKLLGFHTRINFTQDDLTADVLFRGSERPRQMNRRTNRQRSTSKGRPKGQKRTDGGRQTRNEIDRKRYARY